MSATREAIVLPAIFLTVVLAGGFHQDRTMMLQAPSLFSLVMAVLLCAALVQSGTLAPDRLMASGRAPLANLNGLVVLVTLFGASAQAISLVTPESGLPAAIVGIVLLVMLVQLIATSPDRTRLLRGLLVTIGAAFTLKFILLAALSSPADGRVARALQVLFDNVTIGAVSQPPVAPVEGYLAFATLAVYLVGLFLLPPAGWTTTRVEAVVVAREQQISRREAGG